MINQDYKEMLSIFLDNEVKFLVVGAYAMASHGYPRATGDIDLWVEASKENSEKIYKSLAEFGAPAEHYNRETFEEKGVILQIGVAPRRIDIITHIDGVNFHDAFHNKKVIEIENLRVPILDMNDLITNKLSTGREKDILDARKLSETDEP
jgi:hypothetical protein